MADYTKAATGDNPVFMIYVVDMSGSMGDRFPGNAPADPDGKNTRMRQVSLNLEKVFGTMIVRSTRGMVIRPRFDVSIIGYSDDVQSVLPTEVMNIERLADMGVPEFEPDGLTNTAAAFKAALDLLRREMPKRMHQPAPMICHLTDGEYSGDDPEPYAREIMNLRNNDGAGLLENIFIGDGLTTPDTTVENWPGLCSESEVASPYAKKLFRMSSVMPEMLRDAVSAEVPHALRSGVRMLFLASIPELVELGFTITAMTGTGPRTKR